jgi:hypothetical protein
MAGENCYPNPSASDAAAAGRAAVLNNRTHLLGLFLISLRLRLLLLLAGLAGCVRRGGSTWWENQNTIGRATSITHKGAKPWIVSDRSDVGHHTHLPAALFAGRAVVR